MPELPEVEVIKRGLRTKVKGKKVASLRILLPKMVRRNTTDEEVSHRVRGKKIEEVKRRGKALLFNLNSSDVLVFRLGMTGQMLWSHPRSPLRKDKHTHVIINFEKGERILFRDMRQFGEVFVTTKDDLEHTLQMGPEPLERDFTHRTLIQITTSQMNIKQLLMDQRKIAGIGNIYSDEILFEAGIHPLRPAYLLRDKELKMLHRAIVYILNEAIACNGDTIGQYRNAFGESGQYQNYHRVYQRGGDPCQKCRTPVEKIKIGGRSCHFCPFCQA